MRPRGGSCCYAGRDQHTDQFAGSPDLKTEFLSTVSDSTGAHQKMSNFFFSDNPNVDVIIASLVAAHHAAVHEAVKAGLAAG